MERADVLNALIERRPGRRYLEIGVQQGFTFRAVRAGRKVAVDPAFLFDRGSADYAGAEFHEVPSDLYFRHASFESDVFDVIFIDGLHTFEQTLKDLLNAISHLAPDGIIVVDDVLPSTYPASLPSHADMGVVAVAIGETSPAWMGDVYRLVFFIRHFLPGFHFATVAENHGQTLLWRGKRDMPTSATTVEDVARASYADSVLRRDEFNIMPFGEIERRIAATRAD